MTLRTKVLVLLLLPAVAACQPLADESEGEARTVSDTVVAGIVSDTASSADLAGAGEDSDRGAGGEMGVVGSADEAGSVAPADDVTTTADAGLAAESASPKPADPLTPAEIAEANDLALDSPDTEAVVANAVDRDAVNAESVVDVRALSGRPSYRVLYTQRAPDKSGQVRAAEVGIYRYDSNEQVLNNVDLENGQVTAQDLPDGFMMPLVFDEITEATTVARGDPRVQDALRTAGLDGDETQANALLTVGLEPDSPCATNRCVKLFFSTFEQPMPTFHVIVNLSDLSVVEVVPFEMTAGGDTGSAYP